MDDILKFCFSIVGLAHTIKQTVLLEENLKQTTKINNSTQAGKILHLNTIENQFTILENQNTMATEVTKVDNKVTKVDNKVTQVDNKVTKVDNKVHQIGENLQKIEQIGKYTLPGMVVKEIYDQTVGFKAELRTVKKMLNHQLADIKNSIQKSVEATPSKETIAKTIGDILTIARQIDEDPSKFASLSSRFHSWRMNSIASNKIASIGVHPLVQKQNDSNFNFFFFSFLFLGTLSILSIGLFFYDSFKVRSHLKKEDQMFKSKYLNKEDFLQNYLNYQTLLKNSQNNVINLEESQFANSIKKISSNFMNIKLLSEEIKLIVQKLEDTFEIPKESLSPIVSFLEPLERNLDRFFYLSDLIEKGQINHQDLTIDLLKEIEDLSDSSFLAVKEVKNNFELAIISLPL